MTGKGCPAMRWQQAGGSRLRMATEWSRDTDPMLFFMRMEVSLGRWCSDTICIMHMWYGYLDVNGIV